MGLPRTLKLYSAIFLLLLNHIVTKNVEIDFISLQNEVGTDFSSLLVDTLGTEEDLLKEALFNQNELELRLRYDNHGSEIICQGLQKTQQFCPFSQTLHIFTKNDDLTFDEQIEDFECVFLTNEQFSCVLDVDENQVNLMIWDSDLSTVQNIEIFKCTSSESQFCFEQEQMEEQDLDSEILSALKSYDSISDNFNCNRSRIPLNEAKLSISLSQSLYSSQLSSSFNKSLKFLQKMMINFNFYALHSVRMLFKVSELTLNEGSLNLCSTERDSNLELFSVGENRDRGFHMVVDFCSANELVGLQSQNSFCSDQIIAVTLNNNLITNQNYRIHEIIGHLVNSFQDQTTEAEDRVVQRCSQQANLFDTCKSKGFLATRSSTCGNGVLEEGEQCECDNNRLSCECCSNCRLKAQTQCDGLNNACCSSNCKFLSSRSMCRPDTITETSEEGYCRLGKCIESNCARVGYQGFCGVEEDNSCRSKCAVNSNQCVTVDQNNAELFIRDGSLCDSATASNSDSLGECFQGECIVRANNITPDNEDEPIFSSSNIIAVGAFTGLAVFLAILMILFSKYAKKPVKRGLEAGYRVVTKSRYEPSQPQQNEPKPSSTANPHFQISETKPMSIKQKTRKTWYGKKMKKKEIEVVDTPHRCSTKWNIDRTREVFAVDEQEDVVSHVSSVPSVGSGSTLRRNRLSARISKKAPPGLGWKEAEPGHGFTHYRDDEM